MITSTLAEAGSFSSKTRMPRTFLKWPRTYVTIMWRAQNSAEVCPGSRNHLAMGASFAPRYQQSSFRAWRRACARSYHDARERWMREPENDLGRDEAVEAPPRHEVMAVLAE